MPKKRGGITMSLLTSCCKKEQTWRHTSEKPLNDHYSIACKEPVCSSCGDEHPAMIQVCDCCGNEGVLQETRLGEWCGQCIRLYPKDLNLEQ